MERRDLIAKNVPIMAEHGRALAKCASDGVRVLVVANPACTNCLIVSEGCYSLFSSISAYDVPWFLLGVWPAGMFLCVSRPRMGLTCRCCAPFLVRESLPSYPGYRT